MVLSVDVILLKLDHLSSPLKWIKLVTLNFVCCFYLVYIEAFLYEEYNYFIFVNIH